MSNATDNVCAMCIEDDDLRSVIADYAGRPGCTFCGQLDAPTIPLSELGAYIRERLELFFGNAVNQLMYISAEGGYIGTSWTTWELLYDELGLDLERDGEDRLRGLLADAVSEEVWCDYSAGQVGPDEAMILDWRRFSDIVMSQRRFFFHNAGGGDSLLDSSSTPAQLLNSIASYVKTAGLVVSRDTGYTLFRARARRPDEQFTTARELGPPASEDALQSNRMNPPGIPMFYGAESLELAHAEVKASTTSVGTFTTTRRVLLLDLADLPAVPAIFGDCSRERFLATRFFRRFAELIAIPVSRNDRTVLEYIPTQVFTEFLRDQNFYGVQIDGIRYPSAIRPDAGANVVLFATQANIIGGIPDPDPFHMAARWLSLRNASQIE